MQLHDCLFLLTLALSAHSGQKATPPTPCPMGILLTSVVSTGYEPTLWAQVRRGGRRRPPGGGSGGEPGPMRVNIPSLSTLPNFSPTPLNQQLHAQLSFSSELSSVPTFRVSHQLCPSIQLTNRPRSPWQAVAMVVVGVESRTPYKVLMFPAILGVASEI